MAEKYSYFHLIELPYSDDRDNWVLKADKDGKLEIMAGKGILDSEGKSKEESVYGLNKKGKTKIEITIKVKGDYVQLMLPIGMNNHMSIRIGQQQAEKITKDYFEKKK